MGWVRAMISGQKGNAVAAANLRCPTLVLTAELDTLVKPGGQEAFVAGCGDARRVLIAGAYHEPLFEAEPLRSAAVKLVVGWLGGGSVPQLVSPPHALCVQTTDAADLLVPPGGAGARGDVGTGGGGGSGSLAVARRWWPGLVGAALLGAGWWWAAGRAGGGGVNTGGTGRPTGDKASAGGLAKAAALASAGAIFRRRAKH